MASVHQVITQRAVKPWEEVRKEDDQEQVARVNTDASTASAWSNSAGGQDDLEDDERTVEYDSDEDEDEDDFVDLPVEEREVEAAEHEAPRQLQAGLFDEDEAPSAPLPTQSVGGASKSKEVQEQAPACNSSSSSNKQVESAQGLPFTVDETLFIFDWDDTVLPSTFLQRQGLRLDAGSQPTPQQMEILAEVATVAIRTFNAARRHGTVVLITNAERGWIELSCQKFLPLVYPHLENVKLVSARTSFEGSHCVSPTQWKLRAFAVEVAKHFGSDALMDPSGRKNVLSLGDASHEREAVFAATNGLPACCTKSLKFCERPDVPTIIKQHDLIFSAFEQIVHNQGDLDLCIRAP